MCPREEAEPVEAGQQSLACNTFEWNAKNVVVRWCLVMPHGAVTAASACHFGTAAIEHTLVTSPLRGGGVRPRGTPFAFVKAL